MNGNITLIAGDGIGPEIVAEAVKVLNKVAEKYGHTFSYKEILNGRMFYRCSWSASYR